MTTIKHTILFYGEQHDGKKNKHKYYAVVHDITNGHYYSMYGRLPNFGGSGSRVYFDFANSHIANGKIAQKRKTYSATTVPNWLSKNIDISFDDRQKDIYDELEMILGIA